MVPFEYGAVCLSDCFMYLCKKIRFVSQRIFVSAQFFCTTAVLLWGTHWGAVSWIVLFFSCRAIPRARLWAQRARLGKAQFGGRIALRGERIPRTRSGPVWGSDIDYSTHICISASALKDFRLFWRGESEYCSGGSIDVRLEQLALTNVPLLLVFVLIYRWGWRMLWTLRL